MQRRDFLTSLPAALIGAQTLPFFLTRAMAALPERFRVEDLIERARTMAASDYVPPDDSLPPALDALDYDSYRAIRYRPEYALWRDLPSQFRIQFFHRGHFFRQPVKVFDLPQGVPEEIAYSPELFDFGPEVDVGPLPDDLGFAGLRVHHPLNTGDYFDELLSFLGASYFRAIGAGMHYGLSARGIAVNTAEASGEEFPSFTTFYLETPAPGEAEMRLHALLDGPSLTGAYSFTVRPGERTLIDVEARLFTRKEIAKLGVAPLTSMYLFGANDRRGVDDFRPEVHDSDGLQVLTSAGERIWRPLANPENLRLSLFSDQGPRGFGLVQRNRTFNNYQDLEAKYELRPSCWIEPLENWGSGWVELVEIPSDQEANDNIVAYWRPREPIPAGEERNFSYRMHWCWQPPADDRLASAVATRVGRGHLPDVKNGGRARKFVVDFLGGALQQLPENAPITARLAVSNAKWHGPIVQFNPMTRGRRVFFDLLPEDEKRPVELRLYLRHGEQIASETWTYQWTR